MPTRHDGYENPGCPVEAALELVRGKWKGAVLHHLSAGPLHFNELHRRLPTVSQRILTKALRELEADDLVARTVESTVPPRVEYRLGARGERLVPALDALTRFGAEVIAARRPAPAEAA